MWFDLLHGIEVKDVPLAVALEFAILLGYDGQLKQNSKLEIELFASTIKQLKKTKMSRLENALIWLYVKTWGAQGQHVLDQHGIWKFRPDDLDAAIMGIAYPKKNNKSDRIKDLQDLILGRFETGGLDEFYQWSKYFRNEVSPRPSDFQYFQSQYNIGNILVLILRLLKIISPMRKRTQKRKKKFRLKEKCLLTKFD